MSATGARALWLACLMLLSPLCFVQSAVRADAAVAAYPARAFDAVNPAAAAQAGGIFAAQGDESGTSQGDESGEAQGDESGTEQGDDSGTAVADETAAQDDASAAQEPAAQPAPPVEKPPAEYQQGGVFTGGTQTDGLVLSGIRFGTHDNFTRMVLDLDDASGAGATAHPVYSVNYLEYPYRLVVKLSGVRFNEQMKVQSKPALPFSVVTEEDGTIREMQIYLPGPSEFKVIEIDDPAKLSIDIRPRDGVDIPTVYTVQLTGPRNAEEAYALLESGVFPDDYSPSVLVLGDVVVVEQVFTDPGSAAKMEDALRALGYDTIINERRGDELPQP